MDTIGGRKLAHHGLMIMSAADSMYHSLSPNHPGSERSQTYHIATFRLSLNYQWPRYKPLVFLASTVQPAILLAPSHLII